MYSRDFLEEAFDKVHPRARRRRVVHVEARVALQPLPHGRVLVRRIVVRHDVDVQSGGSAPVDEPQEREPVLVRVARAAVVDDPARRVVERGEERRRSVPDVVVGLRPHVPDAQRKARLGPFQRLALRLFVAAEQDGMLGRVEVQADDLPELGREVRVGGHLERPLQMRLDAVALPDAVDVGVRDAQLAGHAARALARPARRRDRGLLHDPPAQRGGMPWLATAAGTVAETVEAVRAVAVGPQLDRHLGDSEPERRLLLGESVRAG